MLYFFRKLEKMSQDLSSAAVVIGALRVNSLLAKINKKVLQIIFSFKTKQILQKYQPSRKRFGFRSGSKLFVDDKYPTTLQLSNAFYIIPAVM